MKKLRLTNISACMIIAILLISFVLYKNIESLEKFVAILSIAPFRYLLLILVLLIGFFSEKTVLLPMLYFRYENIYSYIQKKILLRWLLYFCFTLMIYFSLFKYYSIPLCLMYVVIETFLCLLFDIICRIFGILCKHRSYGYVIFIIFFCLFDLLFDNLNIEALSLFFTSIWYLAFVFPIQSFMIITVTSCFLCFTLYVYLIKNKDKMVSLL